MMGNYVSNCNDCATSYSCKGPSGSESSFQTSYSSSIQDIGDDNTNVSVSYQADLQNQNDTNASANVQVDYLKPESQDKDSLQKGYLIGEINKNKDDEEKDKENIFFKHHDSLGEKLAQKEDTNATASFSVDSTQSNVRMEDILNPDRAKQIVDGHSKLGNAVPTGVGKEFKDISTIGTRLD
jgi:thiamine pyrophosphate-dependent acetolactate synthase large subunit-like protein